MLINKYQSFYDSAGDSPVVKPQSWVHLEALVTHSRLGKIFAIKPHDLPGRKTPRNSFLKGFLWEICFKPLPSSLKPLFHYLYIKTQSIWMVFHSINISKLFSLILILRLCFGEFCALGWDFHHRGFENLIFVKFLHGICFFWWFALVVGS